MIKVNYAQCWEDPRTVIHALEVSPLDDVISIASGGDNIFALLLNQPRSLVAVDMNPAQIFLVELKRNIPLTLEVHNGTTRTINY